MAAPAQPEEAKGKGERRLCATAPTSEDTGSSERFAESRSGTPWHRGAAHLLAPPLGLGPAGSMASPSGGDPRFCQAQSSSAGAPTASPQPSPAAFPPGVASPRLLAPGRCVRARRRHLGQARADAWLSRRLTTICFVSALPGAVALAGGWERVDNELVQTALPSHANSERKSEFVTL